MSKGRVPSHYIVERIFTDPKKWGKDDRKDRYWTGEGYGVTSWGHLYDAKLMSGVTLDETALPICEGCDVVVRSVRLVLGKEFMV